MNAWTMQMHHSPCIGVMAETAHMTYRMVVVVGIRLIVLPIRLKTQGDVGQIVPGTHAGAPHEPQLKKRAWITTGISVVLWCIIAGTIISGKISVRDLDWFDRMSSLPTQKTSDYRSEDELNLLKSLQHPDRNTDHWP